MNKQPALAYIDSPKLHLTEIFYSIQGEGPFAGDPAIFIRLSGCNLQCPQCDTDYRNNMERTVSELLKDIYELENKTELLSHPLIVITGGEPFRQNITELVVSLNENRFQVQIETNGTIFPPAFPWCFCTVVCSPKGRLNDQMRYRVDAYKYVASADSIGLDGLPKSCLGYSGCPDRPPQGFAGKTYLQPLDEKNSVKNKRNQEAVVESCLKHGYSLCLQLHKIIDKE